MSPKETQTQWALSSPKSKKEPMKVASFGAQSNHEENSDTPQFGVTSSVQKGAQSKPLDAQSSSYQMGEPSPMAPVQSRPTVDHRTRSPGVNGQFEDPPLEHWSYSNRGDDSGKGGSRSNGYRPWKTRFSGEGKTSLKQYLRQFELVAKFNGWDDEEKSLQLVTSLEGAALDTLDRVSGPMTYQGVSGL